MLASERQTLLKKLAEFEDTIPHMYLDSEGHVTVGMGHLLNTVAAAQKLPFMDGKTKKKATAEEIKVDFEAVAKQPKGKHASLYKAHTKLILTQSEIDALTESHIDNFHGELKRMYFAFDHLPKEVRLALLDMIFNLGMTRLIQYLKLNRAIKAKDWQKAANESNRLQVQAPRNRYIKDLFEKAAKNASQNKKP